MFTACFSSLFIFRTQVFQYYLHILENVFCCAYLYILTSASDFFHVMLLFCHGIYNKSYLFYCFTVSVNAACGGDFLFV